MDLETFSLDAWSPLVVSKADDPLRKFKRDIKEEIDRWLVTPFRCLTMDDGLSDLRKIVWRYALHPKVEFSAI
jgi:hypothetical protein